MTLDRYAHALPAGDVAAATVIGGLLPEREQPEDSLKATDEHGKEYVIEIQPRAKSSS